MHNFRLLYIKFTTEPGGIQLEHGEERTSDFPSPLEAILQQETEFPAVVLFQKPFNKWSSLSCLFACLSRIHSTKGIPLYLLLLSFPVPFSSTEGIACHFTVSSGLF